MKKFVSRFVLLLVLSFSLSTFLVPYAEAVAEATENFWTTMAPMPTERYFFGVAVVNGKIYAIGGINYGFGYGANATEMYDPVTNTWHTKASLPTPRYDFGIAVVDNKIYVIGGNILGSPSGWNITGVTEVYDPETDTWGALTSMPTPRMSLDANVVNGKIYMIGGFNYTWPYYSLDENEVYDPSTDSWTTKAPIPNATQAYASVVVDNKIYVIGGWKSSFNQIYDPETDTWSYGAPIPTLPWEYPVDSAAAGATTGVAAPKRIYVIGGKQNLDAVNLNQVYDPETDSWSTGAPLPTSRFGLGVAVVDDKLYAIGGVTGWMAPVTATNEQYTPFGFWGPPDTTPPSGTIYIRSDGSVEGTDKIQRDGDVYTFTANISGSIVVERDNIVVDGAGYTLQGTGSGNGINLVDRSNVTVKNMRIMYFYNGIDRPKSKNAFYANYIANNVNGIWGGVSNNTIIGNTITDNTENGISLLFGANHNTISRNKITNNGVGIYYWLSGHDLILKNNITANGFGIQLNAGGENIIIKNNITNNDHGIVVMNSDNNTIIGNTITNNFRGLDFTASENNIVSQNYIANNNDGIHLENINNSIIDNTITNNNDTGIFLYSAGYNNIIGNNITNNRRGILVSICHNNVIHHNNFVNNTFHIETDESNGIWDNGEEGNYWDVYTGVDSNGDGIGDTPYVINENNQDNYPLINPVPTSLPRNDPYERFTRWAELAVAVSVMIVAAVAAALLVYFGKIRKTTGKAE